MEVGRRLRGRLRAPRVLMLLLVLAAFVNPPRKNLCSLVWPSPEWPRGPLKLRRACARRSPPYRSSPAPSGTCSVQGSRMCCRATQWRQDSSVRGRSHPARGVWAPHARALSPPACPLPPAPPLSWHHRTHPASLCLPIRPECSVGRQEKVQARYSQGVTGLSHEGALALGETEDPNHTETARRVFPLLSFLSASAPPTCLSACILWPGHKMFPLGQSSKTWEGPWEGPGEAGRGALVPEELGDSACAEPTHPAETPPSPNLPWWQGAPRFYRATQVKRRTGAPRRWKAEPQVAVSSLGNRMRTQIPLRPPALARSSIQCPPPCALQYFLSGH